MLESPSALQAFTETAGPRTIFVTGSSRDWMFRRTLLGEFTDHVANHVPGTTVAVRRGERAASYWWHQLTGLFGKRHSSRERSIGG